MQRLLQPVALLLCLTACREAPPATPTELLTRFDAAMRAGDSAAAAELVDYDALATAANPDWASIPAGQRTQIITRMKADTAAGLAGLDYPKEGLRGEPAVRGERATVAATGGGQTLTLTMTKGSAGWRIVGGVPGMTSESGLRGEAP